MAFRLRLSESVARGLNRVVKKELRSARTALQHRTPPQAEAIHEARKSLKKVRAVMALIAADNGRGLAKSQKLVRLINRTLSRFRDADAMLAVLAKLRKMHGHALNEHTFARIRRRLAADKEATITDAHADKAWKRLDRDLRRLRKNAKGWRPRHRGFDALAAGIRTTYRRGRKALARARRRQRAADFHEWRKQMKALWYELRLIARCTPGVARDVRVLHEAETWLGDDHNIVVLCEKLSEDVSLCDLAPLRSLADQYQCELRQRAIARAAGIYRSRPKPYVRRVRDAWESWHRWKKTQRRRTHRPAA